MFLTAETGPEITSSSTSWHQPDRNSIEGNCNRPIEKHRIPQWQAELAHPKLALKPEHLHGLDNLAACANPPTTKLESLQKVLDHWRKEWVRHSVLVFNESHRFRPLARKTAIKRRIAQWHARPRISWLHSDMKISLRHSEPSTHRLKFFPPRTAQKHYRLLPETRSGPGIKMISRLLGWHQSGDFQFYLGANQHGSRSSSTGHVAELIVVR